MESKGAGIVEEEERKVGGSELGDLMKSQDDFFYKIT